MAQGLIGTGQAYLEDAQHIFERESKVQQELQSEKQQAKIARQQAQVGLAGTGAAVGFEAGAAEGGIGGPYGALIGGAIGYLAGGLL